MSALVFYLVAAGCFCAGTVAGALLAWHFEKPDPDYDLQNWSDFQ